MSFSHAAVNSSHRVFEVLRVRCCTERMFKLRLPPSRPVHRSLNTQKTSTARLQTLRWPWLTYKVRACSGQARKARTHAPPRSVGPPFPAQESTGLGLRWLERGASRNAAPVCDVSQLSYACFLHGQTSGAPSHHPHTHVHVQARPAAFSFLGFCVIFCGLLSC